MITYGHFIGGKAVAGTSGRFTEVFQPMDGSVRGKVALASRMSWVRRLPMPRQRSRAGLQPTPSVVPAC